MGTNRAQPLVAGTVRKGPRERTAALVQVARYVTVGGLSLAVDFAVLVVLHDVTRAPLWLATTSGYAAAFAVNFGLNLRWVFAAERAVLRRVARYLVLAGGNYVATLGLVLGLTSLGLYYLWAKSAAVVLCAAANFLLYRRWVFA